MSQIIFTDIQRFSDIRQCQRFTEMFIKVLPDPFRCDRGFICGEALFMLVPALQQLMGKQHKGSGKTVADIRQMLLIGR